MAATASSSSWSSSPWAAFASTSASLPSLVGAAAASLLLLAAECRGEDKGGGEGSRGEKFAGTIPFFGKPQGDNGNKYLFFSAISPFFIVQFFFLYRTVHTTKFYKNILIVFHSKFLSTADLIVSAILYLALALGLGYGSYAAGKAFCTCRCGTGGEEHYVRDPEKKKSREVILIERKRARKEARLLEEGGERASRRN